MDINTIIDSGAQAFKQKLMEICKNRELSSFCPATVEVLTDAVKQAVVSAGLATFKAAIESYEEPAITIEREGKTYRYKYTSSRRFLTLFGEVQIARRIYQQDRGGLSIAPLDERWGMANEFVTLDVQEAVLYSVAHNTPEETEGLLKKCALFNPSSTTIKRIANKVGGFFEQNKEPIREMVMHMETIPDDAHALVCSLDGTNILLNEKGKRQGRPLERPKTDTAKDTTAYRNAMVGCLSLYAQRKEDEEHPERLVSRYVGRMPEEKAIAFKADVEFEMRHILKLPQSQGLKKILLMDGQRSLWKYVDGTPLYDGFERLIDFYHTTEHLSKAAEALHGKDSPDAKAWFEKYRKELLENEDAPNAVIRSMYYHRKTLRLTKGRKAALKAELTYFQNNKGKMLYADFLKRGLPIGSGPVEAACKSVVKTRLGRSGMRWSRTGGQNILVFRAYVKSDRWENCWAAFKQLRLAA